MGLSITFLVVIKALGASVASASIAAASDARETVSPSDLGSPAIAIPVIAFLLAEDDALAIAAVFGAIPDGTKAAKAGTVAGTVMVDTTVSGGLMNRRGTNTRAFPSSRDRALLLN
jgi:hypothetical protein